MAGPRAFTLSVPVEHLGDLAALCDAAGWRWRDTGERVASDAGPDAEAVVVVTVPAPDARVALLA